VTPTYRAAFSGDRRNVPLARNAIASFARICGFTRAEVEDIRLAVGEALNNAVEHGHTDRASGFSVLCTFADGEMTIDVRDSGGGFTQDHPGFGMLLMRRLMDSVRYERGGTRVRLSRRHAISEEEPVKA